jgi:transketolase
MKDMLKESKIVQLKQEIAKMAYLGKSGHVPSCFSIIDIIWVLYDKILKINPQNPEAKNRDRFVLSKAHGCYALYAVLAEKNFFSKKELRKVCQKSGKLGAHPYHRNIPGIEVSTGSLGHGLAMAVGMAMALRIKRIKSRVITLIGDGEANEGSIWEAIMLGAEHNLNRLTCIVDYNHSTDKALKLGNLAKKFNAFGWSAKTVDGHDHKALFRSLQKTNKKKPNVVIAKTIKGRGCKVMENNPSWHARFPTKEEVDQIIEQLK